MLTHETITCLEHCEIEAGKLLFKYRQRAACLEEYLHSTRSRRHQLEHRLILFRKRKTQCIAMVKEIKRTNGLDAARFAANHFKERGEI